MSSTGRRGVKGDAGRGGGGGRGVEARWLRLLCGHTRA